MTGAAALAGFACGLRTFAGPLALAVRGGTRARAPLALAAAGELVGDKLPGVPARTAAGPLALRLAAGGFSGHALAGRPGLVAGVAGAAAGSFAGAGARGIAAERTGLPDWPFAVAEDAVAYALAALVA